MDLKTVLLNWPRDHEVNDAICIIGSEPGLAECLRFESLPNGLKQATLKVAPGTYEIKVILSDFLESLFGSSISSK